MDWTCDDVQDSDLSALQSRFAGRIGKLILHLKSTSSTMDDCRALIERSEDASELHGTIVAADRQSAGRGRFGREWISYSHEDVLLSVILTPRESLLTYVTMMGSLACALTVDKFLGNSSAIKWPNDVLVEGKKISGVLAESVAIDGRLAAILGIGLNLNLKSSDANAAGFEATSINEKSLHGAKVARNEVFAVLVDYLNELYDAINRGETIVPEWRTKLETLGQDVQVVNVSPGSPVQIAGIAVDVDDFGRLLIRDGVGITHAVSAGEVSLRQYAGH